MLLQYSSSEFQKPRTDLMINIMRKMSDAMAAEGDGPIIQLELPNPLGKPPITVDCYNFKANSDIMEKFKNYLDFYEHLSLYCQFMDHEFFFDVRTKFPYPLYITISAYGTLVNFILCCKAQAFRLKADELPCQNQLYISTLDRDFPRTTLTKDTDPDTGSFNFDAYKGIAQALKSSGVDDPTLSKLMFEHLSGRTCDVSYKNLSWATRRALCMVGWISCIAETAPPPAEHIPRFQLIGTSDKTELTRKLSTKECGGSNPGAHIYFLAYAMQIAIGMNSFGPVLDGKHKATKCPCCHETLRCLNCENMFTGKADYVPANKGGLLGYRREMYDNSSLALQICALLDRVGFVSIFCHRTIYCKVNALVRNI